MKMKSKLKAMLAAVTIAFAGTALADINTGVTTSGATANNGELFLSVWNTTLGLSYTRDLGINLSNFLPSGLLAPVDNGVGVDYAFGAAPTIGTGNVLTSGYQLKFGLDGTAAGMSLGTLLGTAGTIWSVVASENFGNDRLLFTTNNLAPSLPTAQLQSTTTKVSQHLIAVNGLQGGAADPTSNESSTAMPPSAAYSGSTGFGTSLGGLSFNTSASVGTGLNFWIAEQTAPSASTLSQFVGGDGAQWLLASDGTLTWDVAAVAAPVPEPGTWAMMIAGLGLLGGMARRRTQGRAA